MSNSSNNTKNLNPLNQAATSSCESAETPESTDSATPVTKPARWSFIQNDLEKALGTWQELEKNQATQSPEEQQFEQIKTIISQLKDKLDQF